MLTSTYIHIPRVGRTIEHKIWSHGIRTWDDFLENHENVPMSGPKRDSILKGIEESMEYHKAGDYGFFARSLPSAEHWRAFRDFQDKVAYVDIETTGLSQSRNYITVVGIYDGKEAKTYVRGIDLDEIVEELNKYELLVTFNGARFDLPFIKHEFPRIEFDQLHIDLMYPLRRIGLKGGLKKIEQELGISRSDETTGISGFDAVRLWNEYERGSDDALDLLLEYNREDIVNLKTILEDTHSRFIEGTLSAALES